MKTKSLFWLRNGLLLKRLNFVGNVVKSYEYSNRKDCLITDVPQVVHPILDTMFLLCFFYFLFTSFFFLFTYFLYVYIYITYTYILWFVNSCLLHFTYSPYIAILVSCESWLFKNFQLWITTLKLVLVLSVATNNPRNIFDTSPSESAIFYNVGDRANHTR